MKKIYLVGDPAEDWLILSEKYSRSNSNPEPLKNWQKSDNTLLNKLKGGIGLISELLEDSILKYELELSPNITLGKSVSGDFLQSISKLKPNSQNKNNYHVDEFLGYSISKSEPFTDFKAIDLSTFDLVLIDDLSQDQSNHSNSLLTNLSTFNTEGLIIYKANVPLNGNKLFEKIANQYGNQLVTIIHADHLRESGLIISKKLSWDATLEDFISGFSNLSCYKELSKSKVIIIRFGLEATLAIFQNNTTNEALENKSELSYKFFYIPEKYEEEIKENADGLMQGITSSFVVAFINTYFQENKQNHYIEDICINPILNGMHAAIKCMNLGYEKKSNGELDYPYKQLVDQNASNEKIKLLDLSKNFLTSSPKSLANEIFLRSKSLVECHSRDYTIYGESDFIKRIPKSIFGGLSTYDRDEIENFRTFRKVVMEYHGRTNEKKPLSYAVFGPPGSGKSFGIKKILESLKIKIQIVEKNISQIDAYEDIRTTFQEVRDINLSGKLPIIFFDEFDSKLNENRLGWLKYFLAPMQDGVFKDGESNHPIGKAIFIFAGGTKDSFENFCIPLDYPEIDPNYTAEILVHKNAKFKDFVSRLKGFINIKGIDCQDVNSDILFPFRRAIVLREMLLKVSDILDSNKCVSIDSSLLGALLKIPKFKHGSRSLESIISMSDLKNARTYQKANLPSTKLLNMQLDSDEFMKMMNDQYLSPEIELLAQAIHKDWLEKEIKNGSQNENAVDWSLLQDPIKDSNRQQALDIVRKLDAIHCKLVSFHLGEGLTEFELNDLEKMAEMEHERWMAEKKSKGWKHGPERNNNLRIHNDLVEWNKLPDDIKQKDRDAIKLIPQLLRSVGLGVVKKK